MKKIVRYCNIFFRLRMYFVKRRSLNGIQKFINSYIKYYATVDLTPEMQLQKDNEINRLFQEKRNLETSIDSYVFRYTHNISR